MITPTALLTKPVVLEKSLKSKGAGGKMLVGRYPDLTRYMPAKRVEIGRRWDGREALTISTDLRRISRSHAVGLYG